MISKKVLLVFLILLLLATLAVIFTSDIFYSIQGKGFFYQKGSHLRVEFFGVEKSRGCSLKKEREIEKVLASARDARIKELKGQYTDCIHNIKINHFIQSQKILEYSWACSQKKIEEFVGFCSD